MKKVLLILLLVVVVIFAVSFIQKKKGNDVTLGGTIVEKAGDVVDSVKNKVSDVVDSVNDSIFGKDDDNEQSDNSDSVETKDSPRKSATKKDGPKKDSVVTKESKDESSDSVPAEPAKKTQPKKKVVRSGNAGTASNKNISDCDIGYAENDPLFFGNPSDAYFNVSLEDNYLMKKNNYTMSYNNDTLSANWVAWHLDYDDIGMAPRSNKFVADDDLPDNWYHVVKADYQFSSYGFDRGHLCPSADRTYTADANNETFLMSNMVPQSSDNNRVVWVALEKYQREYVDNGNELYIFAGPAGTGGEGDKGYFEYIPVIDDNGSELRINVPAYTWKIILSIPAGEDDLNRVGEDATVIAVCVPNKKGINSDLSWKKYLCSVDDIENLTGFDFFELLEDDLEETLESRVIPISELR